jgi:DNA-binding MarR family transcriptional regulator
VEQPPDDDRPSDSIGETLDQAMDLTARYLSDRAGLSASAAFLLNRVSREGPARLTSLAAKEGVSQPSMTQLIQRLERQGLVARLADPDDGRVALVAITQAGRALLDDRRRIRRERLAVLLATLSSEQNFALWLSAQVALPILHRLVENADSLAEEGGGQTGRRLPGSTMRLTHEASATELVRGASRITS